MAKISGILDKSQEQQTYNEQADAVEAEILLRMWNPNREFFYNLDKDGKQIPVESITGLYPLLLKNITPEQKNALYDKLEDPQWFATPYPIPTHPRVSKFYDPHYRRKQGPNWEGPVWIDMNHLIVEQGLVKQGDERGMKIAGNIVTKTKELLATNTDVWEFYDPETGQGKRVKQFMWSNLGLHFENYEVAMRGQTM